MGRLIYSAITSLDGCVEDEHGGIEWAAPDPEVHAFVNDLERPVGTYLYGRRMYETMAPWETLDTGGDPVATEFAGIWRAAHKLVFSRTLHATPTARTRLRHDFDVEEVRRLKASSSYDLTVGGAGLAGAALAAGLVDELHLFVCPVLVGGRKRALPDDVRLQLRLRGEHRFRSGVVHLQYAVVR
ncbi:MAG TPA: dihydrofolate reductase family protein [Marmoricola sp.]|nr:dihydrofolate reductase family protein [Marmoricola sp.]